MDKELSKILADCLAEIEGGASVDDCLTRHSSQAADLRPHLETWSGLGGAALVQPSTAAFNRGRQAMRSSLTSGASGFGPLSAVRRAPVWATAMATVAAAVIVLGGAAGASAALGGPDVAGDALDAVGVTNGDGEGGISQSSASERGLECANPNAFEGAANSEDKAQNAVDAHEKESCSRGDCAVEDSSDDVSEADETEDAEVEDDDEVGNAGTHNGNSNANGNGNGNGSANANGQSNGQPCAEDGEGESDLSEGQGDSENGINNAPDAADTGKENANENAFEGSGNADDGSDNRNDNGNPDTGNDAAPGGPPEGQGAGQGQD